MPTHPVPSPVRRPRRRVRVAAAGAACALALVTAACGSSDSDSSSTATTAGSGATTTAASGPTAVTDNAITVTTPGMSYDVSGSLHPGAATITLRNEDTRTHMMALARLKDGVTLDQVRTALDKSEDEAGKLLASSPDQEVYGSPGAVGPGMSSTTTIPDLPAGHYVVLCFFTDDDGTPHWKMGMIDELTVAGAKATDLPDSDGTIELTDSGITMPKGFDGSGTFEITNTGKTEHSISFVKLDEGSTLDDFYQAIGQAQSSQKSVDVDGGVLTGGVDGLLPGDSTYLTVDLDAGHYGYVSTTDATGPQMPPQHGEFDVE